MKHEVHKEKSWAIIYDACLMDLPRPDFFSVEYWRSRQAVTGEAIGRGSAWFVEIPGPVVLRHFLRGGWAAKFSRQSYFFTSISRSRPFREYRLLSDLFELGLPVPRPVAALCKHHGVSSSGAIMTARIDSSNTLADSLTGDGLPGSVWANIGKCIRRFHEAGLWHADLNARNILLNAEHQVFLIDFDRARFSPGKPVNGEGNLKRLKRSLTRFWPTGEMSALNSAWTQLEAAYDK